MEVTALIAILRPVVTAEAVRVLDQIAEKAASGAEEDIRQAERDLLAWITRERDCGHGSDIAAVQEHLSRIDTKLEKIMTDQEQIDAEAAQIEADVQRQSVATANILTKISELETANPGIDFTSLKQAVLDEDTQTANEEAVVPGPVTTTPAAPGDTQVNPAAGDGTSAGQ